MIDVKEVREQLNRLDVVMTDVEHTWDIPAGSSGPFVVIRDGKARVLGTDWESYDRMHTRFKRTTSEPYVMVAKAGIEELLDEIERLQL